ncbi:hypothetical protein [Helicobacter saguini]|uniref:hypothetical protein n=1 Tax=Helicobacter saguini TaxID=1548018 RepID=UPI001925B13F|nr:hypothetical protein [Helicobacter saguini]
MQSININNINLPSKKSLQKKGMKALMSGNFKDAFDIFQNAFWLDSSDLDSKIGLYLADMGLDFGQEAIGIYEFYQSVLGCEPRGNRTKVQKMILGFIKAFDNKTHNLSNAAKSSRDAILEGYDAINYSDIRALLKTKSFKEVYSALPFNAKLMFGKKADFYEFLSLLADNDYIDTLVNYIDSLPIYDLEIMPIIETLTKKLQEKNKLNGKDYSPKHLANPAKVKVVKIRTK